MDSSDEKEHRRDIMRIFFTTAFTVAFTTDKKEHRRDIMRIFAEPDCCFTAALLLLYCCFTAALLLLYCCITAALL